MHRFRGADGAGFYNAALEYAHSLWLDGLPGRAILLLDRALFAESRPSGWSAPQAPCPYAALRWILENHPEGSLVGNPRVHFQHLADRLQGARREQRRWRVWAAWAITRHICPELSPDLRHRVVEPTFAQIEAALGQHGLDGEAACWQRVLEG
ncbi:MAG: hypothetical protein ACFBZ8_03455 [Opitutales bacterium]